MMLRRHLAVVLLIVFSVSPCMVLGQQPSQTTSAPAAAQSQQPGQQPSATPDPNDPIVRIKDEGMNRSQVMQTLSYLSDVIGPRLTASPNAKRANEWTRDKLTSWGLQNGHLEAWGPFGRGWTLKHFSAQIVEPQDIPLIAYPKAWSPGIKVMPAMAAAPPAKGKQKMMAPAAPQPSSVVTADVIYLDARNEADLEKYKGQLKGKIVLISPTVEVKALFDPLGARRDEKNLLALANANPPGPGGFGGGGGGGRGPGGAQMTAQERAQQQFQQT